MENERIKIGMTHGNAEEYDYQILARILSEPFFGETALPFAYASSAVMSRLAKSMGLHETTFASASQWADLKGKRPLLWETAENSFAALQQALSHLQSGELKALVTLPADADKIKEDCPEFKNIPLWLSSHFNNSRPFRMWLLEKWRYTFMTSLQMDHLPERLSADRVRERIESLYHTLKSDFCITSPRIAVLSMNPDLDAKEPGDVDRRVLQPLLADMLENGKMVFGPYNMRTFFSEGRELSCDAFHAVLCPYKEQSDWIQQQFGTERLCAYTAGLPFVQMEPVYTPKVTPLETALRCTARALYETMDICRSRALYARLTVDPLYGKTREKLPVD